MMQAREVEALITAMVEPLLEDTDMTLVDVEYVREKDWYLRIFLDKPGGVEIDDCQMVSERLTEVLDAKAVQVKKIIKGKEFKNPDRIERRLIANIRPHIDF